MKRPFLSTKELGNTFDLKPRSIHARLCRTGSFYGVIPVTLPNGRLAWPPSVLDLLGDLDPRNTKEIDQ